MKTCVGHTTEFAQRAKLHRIRQPRVWWRQTGYSIYYTLNIVQPLRVYCLLFRVISYSSSRANFLIIFRRVSLWNRFVFQSAAAKVCCAKYLMCPRDQRMYIYIHIYMYTRRMRAKASANFVMRPHAIAWFLDSFAASIFLLNYTRPQ